MVATRSSATTEIFDWLEPSPLWATGTARESSVEHYQPALVELTTDAFMDEFIAIAPSGPKLSAAIVKQPAGTTPRSLYLPIHGTFYLVAASLTCRRPGFPDRVVRTGDNESAFFVLRKLEGNHDDGWVEHGWIQDGDRKGWHPLPDDPCRLLSCDVGREERLPLFPVQACGERTLLSGYLATSSREMYSVPAVDVAPNGSDINWPVGWPAGVEDLRVLALYQAFFFQQCRLGSLKWNELATRRLSVYLLLSFWEFLAEHVSKVAEALRLGTTASLQGADRELVTTLGKVKLGGSLTLDAALAEVAKRQAALNNLGDAGLPTVFTSAYNLTCRDLSNVAIYEAVSRALSLEDTRTVEIPRFSADGSDVFVVRCVYERPQCEPKQHWVSQPSIPFRIALLYDPDAPVRNIQLALPMDLSMAGLRRMKKGVSVQLPPSLQQKLGSNSIFGESPMPPDSLGVAMICTFSIPIITLCAFALLLVLVVVLNIVFQWLPFFRICVPVRSQSEN